MANAGRHNDTRVLKRMIREGKLIKVLPGDHAVAVMIKQRFNDIVLADYVTTYRYNGKNYPSHTAWELIDRALIKVNQLRLRHRFYSPLSFE